MTVAKRYFLPTAPRRSLVESLHHPRLDHPVRIYVAHPDDSAVLTEYFAEVFSPESQLFNKSGAKPEEIAAIYKETIEKSTTDGLTVVLADCFEVYGGLVCWKRRVEDYYSRPKNTTGDWWQEVKTVKGPSMQIRILKTFCDEFESHITDYLPKGTEEYLWAGLFSVHSKFRRCGFGSRLVFELLRLAKELKIRHVVVGCSGKASTALFKSAGFREVFAFPYAKFKVNEQLPLGESMSDGATECRLLIADLDTIEVPTFPPCPLPYELKGEREVVDANFFVKRLNRTLKIVVATVDDTELVTRYIRNEFYRQAPVAQTVQIPREDVELFANVVYNIAVLREGLTLLAVDGDRVCALLTNKVLPVGQDPVDMEIPADYAKLAPELAYYDKATRKARIRGAFFRYFYTRGDRFFPPDCKEFLVNDLLSVHPDYRGCGLGDKLWLESNRRAKRHGIRYALSICTAIGSTRVAEKAGMKGVLAVPYERFIYEGKPALRNNQAYDGGKVATVLTVDLATIYPDIEFPAKK